MTLAQKKKIVRAGSDFTGVGTFGLAVKHTIRKLKGWQYQCTHACDAKRCCQKLIMHHHPDIYFSDNIVTREVEEVPACDLFSFTPPCSPFSSSGKRKGAKDPLGRLALYSLKYICYHKPYAVLMENVVQLCKGKHRRLFNTILRGLDGAKYTCRWSVLSTEDYGLPQHRKRLYLIAIRNDRLRATELSWFPPPLRAQIPFKALVPKLPRNVWRALPEGGMALDNVKNAYVKCVAKGINPFITPVVIDAGSSTKYASFQVNRSPTLTGARAGSLGYWCSTKGGPLTAEDCARLQGFDLDDLHYEAAGLSPNQFAGCMGQANSFTVMRALIPMLMWLACMIDDAELAKAQLTN